MGDLEKYIKPQLQHEGSVEDLTQTWGRKRGWGWGKNVDHGKMGNSTESFS